MTALALTVLGLLLIGGAPRVLSGLPALRRSPRPTLMLWQATAFVGTVCVIAAGPVAAVSIWPLDRAGVDVAAAYVALAVSGLSLAMVLVNGHLIGSHLRRARRTHEELLDLVGDEQSGRLTVLSHPTPTAYCVPGRRRRVVLSTGVLEQLAEDELAAVLAHERAHLGERHDLLLEYFTVSHRSAPPWLRSRRALREVRLLIEVLADRAAREHAGDVPLARALVRLSGAHTPQAMMGAADTAHVTARMNLLAAPPAPRWQVPCVYAATVLVVALPLLTVLLTG